MLAAALAAAATGASSTASTRAQQHAQNEQIREQVEEIEQEAQRRGLQRAEEEMERRRRAKKAEKRAKRQKAADGNGNAEEALANDGTSERLVPNKEGKLQPRSSAKRPGLGKKRAESSSTNFSADAFFATQDSPASLSRTRELAEEFVARHGKAGRKVVLVTSGGTTVPLEQNVVRFLDNFSAGTRGATSAEYFLSAGYAVIFMHRQHSLSPYTRHYSHTTNPFLDLLSETSEASGSTICVKKEHEAALNPVLRSYHAAQKAGTLLRLNFVTVTDYLFMLREMSRVMQSLGRHGMYYLAAAVSDFYVPSQKTPEHKIQSGKGSLVIEMDQVPKVLKPMVQEWAPEGFVVSFKLETDENLLIPKARTALERYGHQVVIGNDLQRRKYEVVFVERLPSGEFQESWLRLDEGGDATVQRADGSGEREIEEDIVSNLSARHSRWIEAGGKREASVSDNTTALLPGKTSKSRHSSRSKPRADGKHQKKSKNPSVKEEGGLEETTTQMNGLAVHEPASNELEAPSKRDEDRDVAASEKARSSRRHWSRRKKLSKADNDSAEPGSSADAVSAEPSGLPFVESQ